LCVLLRMLLLHLHRLILTRVESTQVHLILAHGLLIRSEVVLLLSVHHLESLSRRTQLHLLLLVPVEVALELALCSLTAAIRANVRHELV
jgi:hypothetical protein